MATVRIEIEEEWDIENRQIFASQFYVPDGVIRRWDDIDLPSKDAILHEFGKSVAHVVEKFNELVEGKHDHLEE